MPQSSKVLCELKNISLHVNSGPDAKNPEANASHAGEMASGLAVGAVGNLIWAVENAEFIAECNERVEAEGTLLQEWRTF